MSLNKSIGLTALIATIITCIFNNLLLQHEREQTQNNLNILYIQKTLEPTYKQLVASVSERNELSITNHLTRLNKINEDIDFLFITLNKNLISSGSLDESKLKTFTNAEFILSNIFDIHLIDTYQSSDGYGRAYRKSLSQEDNVVLYIGVKQSNLLGYVPQNNLYIYATYFINIFTMCVAAYLWAYILTFFIKKMTHIVNTFKSDLDPQYKGELSYIPEFGRLIKAISSLALEWNKLLRARQLNEQYLSATLSSIGDAVITTDINNCITQMNPVAEQLTGWSTSEAKGQQLETVFSIFNASHEPIVNTVNNVIYAGNVVHLSDNTKLVSKNGKEYRIADSAAPICNKKGEVFGAVMVFSDATERYTLRKKIKGESIRLKSIFNDMQTMIGILDLDGKLTFVNNTPLNITGVTEREVLNVPLNKSVWFNYDVKVSNLICQDIEAAAAGGRTLREVQAFTSDGLLWVSLAMHPVLNEDGIVKEIFAETYDISDSKKTEEHFRRSQKMDALGKLTGGIAHDYNNMLGVILGYAEMLESELVSQPELSDYVSQIINATQRSVNLTRKLLNFSREKNSNVKIVDINEVLLKQQDMLEKSVTVAILLKFDLEENLWSVSVEEGDLEDLILNLSINSMHAINAAKPGEITYSTRNERIGESTAQLMHLKEGDYVKFSVSDNGCGMDLKTKQRVFDPFFTTKGVKGTGLGLSQVYGFVKRSRGGIIVYSEVNRGSKFEIYLPRDFNDPSQKKDSPENADHDISGSETILLVDDEPALVMLASQILSKQGYHVITANSADEALSCLKRKSVDLLLSDVIMPGMDGYELAKIVHQKYPNIKIQMASGFTSEHRSNENTALSKHLLEKPYKRDDLLSRVRKVLDNERSDNYMI